MRTQYAQGKNGMASPFKEVVSEGDERNLTMFNEQDTLRKRKMPYQNQIR